METPPLADKISIAVLPFVNMSANADNEYFCDGITEEIINALAKIEQLKVTSRTSSFFFKGKQATMQEVGEQLGVKTVLEGSVRIAGTALRINAQLINVEEDTPFWAEIWNRKLDNIFEVQDEISLLIADKLREQYGHLEIAEQLVVRPTADLNAYQSYLQGQFYFNQWNPEAANKAIQYFEQAVALDPNMIEPWLGLADAYGFLATTGFAPREDSWQQAQQAIQKASAIDSENAALNYQLANYAFFTEADYAQAFRYTQKSIARKPTYPEAQQFMAFLYVLQDDLPKANEHLQYAKAIDPLNQETLFYEGYILYRSKQYTAALEIYDKLLANNPKNLPALISKCYALLKLGQYDAVLEILKDPEYEPMIMSDEKLGLLTLSLAIKRDTATLLVKLPRLKEQASQNSSHQADTYLFLVYVALEQYEQAFQLLEKLFTHKSSILLLNFADPLAEKLQQHADFHKLHKKIYPPVKTQKKKTSSSALDEATTQQYIEQLQHVAEEEKPYLNPTLTLRSLAAQLEIHPNQLSWLLNNHLGKNFNEYINQYRIEYFKKLVVDPSNDHISLIGLAYESGFNSKTVFNTYFKKSEGMTPKQYQKRFGDLS